MRNERVTRALAQRNGGSAVSAGVDRRRRLSQCLRISAWLIKEGFGAQLNAFLLIEEFAARLESAPSRAAELARERALALAAI